jgi:hypothetical protein
MVTVGSLLTVKSSVASFSMSCSAKLKWSWMEECWICLIKLSNPGRVLDFRCSILGPGQVGLQGLGVV